MTGTQHTGAVHEVLQRADESGLASLPASVPDLLERAKAPPRLVAHLALVHDVAHHIVAALGTLLSSEEEGEVLFGSATHDIGKALHPEELDSFGSEHECAGEAWLLAEGVSQPLARFARTHGYALDAASVGAADLLVKLADTSWKGKRVEMLEERVARELACRCERSYWDVYLLVSDIAERIGEHASRRLEWQRQFPSR